ncbi:MAG: glycosyltransferase family 4 protein [Vicingaceae bacterium]
MQILQIALKPVYPLNDGGKLAIKNMTDLLNLAGCSVKILSISTPKHGFHPSSYPKGFIEKFEVENQYINTDIKPFKALKSLLFSSLPYNLERFIENGFKDKLKAILQKQSFDVILFESLFTTPYVDLIKQYSKAKLVFRPHNIEHEIWYNLSLESKGIKAAYYKHLAKRLKSYELQLKNKFDAVITISKNDDDFFSQSFNCKILNIPFTLNKTYTDEYIENQLNLFFIGSMDWEPNIKGMLWFLKNVWEKVSNENKSLQFHIAGRNIEKANLPFGQYKNLVVHQNIENAVEFMQSNGIMVVPLFSGSGIRIKILEAMACAKPIISTTKGAVGIDYSSDQIKIADDPDLFIQHILDLTNHFELRKKLGNNALNLIKNRYLTSNYTIPLKKLFESL